MRLSYLVLLTLVACVSLGAGAQPARPNGARVVHQFHTQKDGAPEGIRAFAQTADGYLWVGAESGLYRFDGMRFELFRPPLGDQLLHTSVAALFAPARGGLWVGYTYHGTSFIKDGKVTNFRGDIGVYAFAGDRNGVVWAGATTGLWQFENSTWKQIGGEWDFPSRGEAVTHGELGFDREGRLWVFSGTKRPKRLFFLPPGEKKFRRAGENLSVTGFTFDADHYVVTTHERAAQRPGPGLETRKLASGLSNPDKGAFSIPRPCEGYLGFSDRLAVHLSPSYRRTAPGGCETCDALEFRGLRN